MALKFRFSKESIKDHFRYYIWIYVAVIVVTGVVFDLITTSIVNQSSEDKKLYACICGDTLAFREYYGFMEDISEAVPGMSIISCENLTYNEGTMAQTYKQKFYALFSSEYGDVMMLPYNEFSDLAQYGYFLPLEDVLNEYIDDVDPINLKTVTYNITGGDAHVYGIPLSHLKFFPDVFDTTDKVLVVTSYSKNMENAKLLIQWWLDYMINTDWDN